MKKSRRFSLRRKRRKLARVSSFVLSPWEHAATDFNPAPHAQTRLEIGGKKRNFLLKLREGVIWFKEPSRGAIFGTLALFPDNLTRDSIGLISAWQKEMAAENFGVLLTKRDYFPKTTCRGRLIFLFKGDGSGWMREHFDHNWFDIPPIEPFVPFSLWNPREAEEALQKFLGAARAQLINRAINPAVRELEPPQFFGPHADAFEAVLRAALQLFVSATPHARTLQFKAHSSFAKGEIEGYDLNWCLRAPGFALVWKQLESTVLAGVNWSEGGEELTAYNQKRNEKFHAAGLEKWGENWRGNWAPRRAKWSVELPTNAPSAHEKIEAAKILRDWSRGKSWENELSERLRAL